jgi:DNA-binding transcriptional ArsR family regulator
MGSINTAPRIYETREDILDFLQTCGLEETSTRLLFLALWSEADPENDHTCSLAIKEIAAKTNLHRSTVMLGTKKLEERGFISVYRSCGVDGRTPRANVYRVAPPSEPIVVKPKRKTIGSAKRYRVLKRDRFRCVFCGRSPATDLDVELVIDHIVPVCKGGSNADENLQVLCFDCNSGKSDDLVDE